MKRVFVKEGDSVKKGQLLMVLDDAEARAQAAFEPGRNCGPRKRTWPCGRGGIREEVLSLDAQLVKATTDRDSAQRNLDALKKLEQPGSLQPEKCGRAKMHSPGPMPS